MTYDDLKDLSPEDQMFAIIDALNAIEDPAARAQAGALLLGRGYKVMGTAIAGGSAELKKLQEQAKKQGLIISDEDLANAEAFNDAMSTLGVQFKAAFAKVILPAIKKLVPLLQKFADWAGEHPKMASMAIQITAVAVALKLLGLGGAVATITKGIGGSIKKVATFIAARLAPLGVSILSGPLGWAALGAVVLGGAAYAFWPEIKHFFTEMWTDLKAWFSKIDWGQAWKYVTPIGLGVLLWDNTKESLKAICGRI